MSTISLCMIVKNEEQTLGRCLRSVAGVSDEIAIVDTGSNDDTKSIAESFTSRVFDFAWVDDFAAARNYSFAQATMDWILWLDADDVLLPEDRTKLLALKTTLGNAAIDAVSMIYHTNFDESNNVMQSGRNLRLVRRSKNFVWRGVVHEELVTEEEFRYVNSDVVITHRKPPSESGTSRRNLLIYEKHINAGRQLRPRDLFQYGLELEANEDYDKAIMYFEKYLASDENDVDRNLFALHRLARCYYLTGDVAKEWECTLKSLEFDVPRPEFSCRFAERFLNRNQFRQAIFWYELALAEPGKNAGDWMVDNYPFKTWLPHKQLGLCYYKIGDYPRSLHHNQLAHQYLPNDPGIETNIRLLEKLVNESADKTQAGEA